MRETWNIIYYDTGIGSSPVYDFIEGLSPKAKAKIFHTFNLLEAYGTQVGEPHVSHVTGTPLWEIRVLGKDNIRIFYVAAQRKTFLLLHGFIKKSRKAPKDDIDTALARWHEYQSREG